MDDKTLEKVLMRAFIDIEAIKHTLAIIAAELRWRKMDKKAREGFLNRMEEAMDEE